MLVQGLVLLFWLVCRLAHILKLVPGLVLLFSLVCGPNHILRLVCRLILLLGLVCHHWAGWWLHSSQDVEGSLSHLVFNVLRKKMLVICSNADVGIVAGLVQLSK
jgi:hypothetical protein